MSGPIRETGAFVRGQQVESEQRRLTVADWEGFDVEGRLGVGSTGTVWLARQLSVGRLVALKELAPELADNQAVREHLRHEAQVLARLDDPNCVAVYSYLESASRRRSSWSTSRASRCGHSPDGPAERRAGPLGARRSAERARRRPPAGHRPRRHQAREHPPCTSGESKLVDFGLAAAVGTRRAPGTGARRTRALKRPRASPSAWRQTSIRRDSCSPSSSPA